MRGWFPLRDAFVASRRGRRTRAGGGHRCSDTFARSGCTCCDALLRLMYARKQCALGGKENPSADDITKLMGSVGVEADSDKLKKFLAEMDGKNLAEVLAAGKEKLASLPSGGAAVAAAPAAAGGAPAAGGAAAAAPEPEEEEEEEDMEFDLFD